MMETLRQKPSRYKKSKEIVKAERQGVYSWVVVKRNQRGETTAIHVCTTEARAVEVVKLWQRKMQRQKLGGDVGYLTVVVDKQKPGAPHEAEEWMHTIAPPLWRPPHTRFVL